MKQLYIDFDGVILDTIPIYYKIEKEMNGDVNDPQFWKSINFEEIIKDELILNDSIECIKKLIESNKFIISILTHVASLEEGIVKINYLRKYFNDITIILVPKSLPKTKMIHTEDAILVDDYSGNLREWEKSKGIGVRFSQDLESKGFKVINKLDQLLDMF